MSVQRSFFLTSLIDSGGSCQEAIHPIVSHSLIITFDLAFKTPSHVLLADRGFDTCKRLRRASYPDGGSVSARLLGGHLGTRRAQGSVQR